MAALLSGPSRCCTHEGVGGKEFYGVGPTQAKTYYYDDLVVCVLRGGFTRVEQTLLEGGRTSAVIQQRMEFQEVMRDRFAAVIERATGVVSGGERRYAVPTGGHAG